MLRPCLPPRITGWWSGGGEGSVWVTLSGSGTFGPVPSGGRSPMASSVVPQRGVLLGSAACWGPLRGSAPPPVGGELVFPGSALGTSTVGFTGGGRVLDALGL